MTGILERDCVPVLGKWVAKNVITIQCGWEGVHGGSCAINYLDGHGWQRCFCPCHDEEGNSAER